MSARKTAKKVTIYAAYGRDGHFCCWHHERAVAAHSAGSTGFVKQLQVRPFKWPNGPGPHPDDIPMHVTPPKSRAKPAKRTRVESVPGLSCVLVRGKEHSLKIVRSAGESEANLIRRWRAMSGSDAPRDQITVKPDAAPSRKRAA